MEYSIVYSKRKSIGISIKDGGVIVKAPYGIRKADIDKIVSSHREWIDRTLVRERKKALRESELTEDKICELKAQAKKYFTDKCSYYADIMGVRYGALRITSAKTQYGSCSSKGNICFSYRLMLFPEEAREYVVVHELAHRTEMNHSPRFYAIVEKYLPDYRERRALLKDREE